MTHRAPTPDADRFGKFRAQFWQPPRAHGDVIEDRTVSFLELFYDLVYVVVISRAAHTLAEHLTVRGVVEFAIVFGLIFVAWVNGTVYQDLHGRGDGRSRTFVFAQMLILSVLAVYTADAAGESGAIFAWVYTAFLVLLTWLWYSVRRQDAEEYMDLTRRYLIGMVISVVVMAFSALLPETARLVTWGLFALGWVFGNLLFGRLQERSGVAASESGSLVERFGLFTIIVLGEVVVGVVTGLSEANRSFGSLATGIVGLMIGFSFWWTYFDFVGGRRPRLDSRAFMSWATGHLPVYLAIAASGAAMVGLIEHSGDSRAPVGAAWLLSGSVALGLVGLVGLMRTLADYERFSSIYRPLTQAMFASGAVALLIGWARPAPWLLALLLVLTMSAVWVTAIYHAMNLENPADVFPSSH